MLVRRIFLDNEDKRYRENVTEKRFVTFISNDDASAVRAFVHLGRLEFICIARQVISRNGIDNIEELSYYVDCAMVLYGILSIWEKHDARKIGESCMSNDKSRLR